MPPFVNRQHVRGLRYFPYISKSRVCFCLRSLRSLLSHLSCISQVRLSLRHLPSKYLERVKVKIWRMTVLLDFSFWQNTVEEVIIYFHIFTDFCPHKYICLSYFGCLVTCLCVLNLFWLQCKYNFSGIHFWIFLIELMPLSMKQTSSIKYLFQKRLGKVIYQ